MRTIPALFPSALILIATIHSGAALSQGYRTELISHTTLSMTVGDLDGDGDTDIISGGIQNLVWNANNGDGTFERRTISLDPQEAQCVLMEDLDQDGHQDILVADMAANRILYYRNNGDNTFDRYFLFTGSTGTASIAVADLDNDGDLDVACAAFTGNKIFWLRNDGGFAFTSVTIATGMTGAAHVLVNDYDGDGDVDIAAAMQTAGAIRLFRNDGSGSFTNELLANLSTPRRLVQEDIDQDGDMDLLYAGTGGLGYFRNNAGVLTQQSVFTYNGCRGIGAADVTGDGYKDLLFTDYAEDDVRFSTYSIASNDFTGGGVTLDTDFDYASLIMAADLDGDGRNDIVCGSSFDIRVYMNNGGNTFTRRPLNRYLGAAKGVCHGDFDNDGDVDMMAVGGLYLDWYVNDGSGHLEARILREGPARIQVSGGTYLAAADMDGDGDTDAVLSERGGNKLSWIENLGNGNFAKRLVASLTDAYGCEPVDFDGDGDMDVLASNLNGGFVYWYENNGAQVFTQHTVNTTYPTPYEVRAYDYDNDGDMDVVSACYSNLQQIGKVVLFRNMGNGTFQAQEVDASAPNTTSVFWVDLDSDGDIDIVSTMGDSDQVVWYENNGTSTPFFTERVVAYGVRYATYVVAADLDGDGDIDIVTSALEDRTTDWFENDGQQVFTRHRLALNIFNPQFVGTGDIDGDGVLEIYATCAQTEAVHLYHRTGINTEPVQGPPPTACHDLFISEMVHQPGDIALALEIYNPRSVPVDLTGYAIRFHPNGDADHYDGSMLTGIIPPGGTHVVVAPNYATNIIDHADQVTNLWFDGSEAIVLVNGDVPIDVIGRVGESFDDGDHWFSNGVGTFYTVLVRKPTIDKGDPDGTDAFLPDVEWIAYPVNDYSHLGSHTSPCSAVCTPSVTIAANAAEVCPGEQVMFTATPSDGGSSPSYQWLLNGTVVGGTGATYTTPALSDDATIQCAITSNAACAPATAVAGNIVHIVLVPAPAPVASVNGTTLTASPVANATYQWYFEGDQIPGATGQTYIASQTGLYSVAAIVQGCPSEPSDAVQVLITEVATAVGISGVSLFPNPTEGMLTIGSEVSPTQVEVRNALGALVLRSTGRVLDLSDQARGVYSVTIITGNERHQQRVVLR
ncbi:MAG: FG-GAP-like repeat-containing protein [Flavobacteriales bacterium]